MHIKKVSIQESVPNTPPPPVHLIFLLKITMKAVCLTAVIMHFIDFPLEVKVKICNALRAHFLVGPRKQKKSFAYFFIYLFI